MTDTAARVDGFFDRYSAALLARDEHAIGGMYAVPALILAPGTAIPVTDSAQTVQFFGSSWDQYAGVDTADRTSSILCEAPGFVWVDVTWSYGDGPQERFCYQLAEDGAEYRIVVLTPLAL